MFFKSLGKKHYIRVRKGILKFLSEELGIISHLCFHHMLDEMCIFLDDIVLKGSSPKKKAKCLLAKRIFI